MARRGRKSNYDKLKELDPDFVETTLGMQKDELKNKIVDITKYQMEILDAKTKDLDLISLVEQTKIAGEVYRTNLKAIRLKLNYLIELLKEKGA